MARRNTSLIRPRTSRVQRPACVSREKNRGFTNLSGAIERTSLTLRSDGEGEACISAPVARRSGERYYLGEASSLGYGAIGTARVFIRAEQSGAVETEEEQQFTGLGYRHGHVARDLQHCGCNSIETRG